MSAGTSPRILFFAHSPRTFMSAQIGNLYEVAQEYRVTLLTQPLPESYVAHLEQPALFPGLERIWRMEMLGYSMGALVRNNRRWLRLASEALDACRPDLVIGENDNSSVFDMYLLREARRRGIERLTIQATSQIPENAAQLSNRLAHRYATGTEPGRLTALWRAGRFHLRKRGGHLLAHYLLPWSAGASALSGDSSYVTRAGAPGMRDSSLHLVQDVPQYHALVQSRVEPSRLGVLYHPATRIPLDVFCPPQTNRCHTSILPGHRRVLVLVSSTPFGIDKATSRLIPQAQRQALSVDIVRAIAGSLQDWQIVVRGHPDLDSSGALDELVAAMPGRVTMMPATDPVEPLLPLFDAVVSLPSPSTSLLVTASSACPGTPVIAADLDHDALGDLYREWPGIEYVDSMGALVTVLTSIREGLYARRVSAHGSLPAGMKHFGTTGDAVRSLLGGGVR